MGLSAGTRVGKYELLRELGAGGFGRVFAALDPTLDREVALKFLKSEHAASPDTVKRFLQEARSAAKIVHPGIVTVFECSEVAGTGTSADGTAFIAMELLEGQSLAERLQRRGPCPVPAALEIGRQLASALEAAHRAGIVHRDLKPDNVFLVEDSLVPGGERAKVLDFGIAKLRRAQAGTGMQTESLLIFGTPQYMSPEQCKSAAGVDHRSDIYTLGLILFEMLVGRTLFVGQPGELIAQHVLVAPPSTAEAAPGAPPALAALIDRMLAKEPEGRPPTMAAVQRALEAIAIAMGASASLMGMSLAGMSLAGASLAGGSQPGSSLPAEAASFEGPTKSMTNVAAAGSPESGDFTVPHSLVFEESLVRPAQTTLSSMAGSSVSTQRVRARRARAMYAGAAVLAVAAALVFYFVLRGSGDGTAAPPRGEATVAGAPPRAIVEPIPAEEARVGGPEVAAQEVAAQETAAPASSTKPAQPERSVARVPQAPARTALASPPIPSGHLVITSKPACEIYVDETNAGLRTPATLRLNQGKHRVTLVNKEHKIRESFTVVIVAGAKTNIAKDYSAKLPRDQRDATINPFAKGSP